MGGDLMLSFVYQAHPARILFGLGSLDKVSEEFERLGVTRALVLSTPEQHDHVKEVVRRLGERVVSIFDRVRMHVPLDTAAAARAEASRIRADCCVAVGGGSTTGLAKAIALVSNLPILSIPTTYAGSEMTPIWGLTEDGVKKTGRDIRVLPKTVLYDPSLTITMPLKLSATSGMNAIAHCVEAMYAQDANPIISMIAEEGIRALVGSLPTIMRDAGNLEARSQALYGAWLAGTSLGAVGMALHHKLCHTLGGTFNLPHAETHSVVLPHATAYNTEAASVAMTRVARALGAGSAAAGLYDLAASLGCPMSLSALGMKLEDLDMAADLAVRDPYDNPRRITRDSILLLLTDALEGRRPRG
jgi:maleylacetate reductase